MGGRSEIAESQATRILAGIWETAFDPSGWDALLRQLAEAFDAPSAKAAVIDLASGRAELLASHRIDPAISARWQQGGGGRDLWAEAGLARARLGERTGTGAQLVPLDEYHRSPIYHEVSRPSGHEDALATLIDYGAAPRDERIAFVSLYRGMREGLFERGDVEAFGWVGEQIRGALALQGRVVRRAAAEASLESLAGPALVCDARGRVEAANPEAAALLREGDGIRCARGTLRAAHPEDDRALHHAIGHAAATARGEWPGGGRVLPLRRGERAPLGALVAPLPGSSPATRLAELREGPAVLVALSDPEARPELPAEALRRLFGLSPAEARMAAALARGASLAEYAEEAGIGIETARTRVKALFRKTGTRGQADLVRVLLASVAALRER